LGKPIVDLFEDNRQRLIAAESPLADRMRPRSLEEFVGQDHILGRGRLLRRAIQADQLSSLIFYGPPGTGKTTLARIIANTTRAHFVAINAVLSGVKEIRAAIETAQSERGRYSRRTILFVDEVHRFNKAQQDALLPWVENGTVILIGATTENPYFEVNKALVSRSRLFQLKSLEEQDMYKIADQALKDPGRGYGKRSVVIAPEALDHLAHVAGGDARTLLNALELAVETTPENAEGNIVISLDVAEESIQRRAVLYDREGDAHFDTISAFIKSLRGSDPDAALYWLARMLYAGEDPHFIFRRLLIQASEDIGLADPQALGVVVACAEAFDRVGLPEGRYHLAQATLYLSTAAKSNSTLAFFDALAAVEREGSAEVPNPLKDSNRDKQGFGHGAGYQYPHAYREHWVAQQYLPASLQGQVFYQPSDQGYEAQIRSDVARRREAQLAALQDLAPTQGGLTFGSTDPSQEQWFARALSQSGQQLGHLRDRLFALAEPERHHVVLDLHADTGLLTWEALRRTPEGGVYTCVRTLAEAQTLEEQVSGLGVLHRPMILVSDLENLGAVLREQVPGLHFDRIVGRNVFTRIEDKKAMAKQLAFWLRQEGMIALAQSIPRHTQRLYQLLKPAWFPENLYERLRDAEEAIYADPQDILVNWDAEDFQQAFTEAGLQTSIESEHQQADTRITAAMIDRWFTTSNPTYASRLRPALCDSEIALVGKVFAQRLQEQIVPWKSQLVFLNGKR
jgi:putative ATPase